jgi:hypothetical protein
LLILDHELTVSLVLSRCLRTETGSSRWMLRFEESLQAPTSPSPFGWMKPTKAIKDYYLFPAHRPRRTRKTAPLRENNHSILDAYRFDDLEFFFRPGRADFSGGCRMKARPTRSQRPPDPSRPHP